MIQNLDERFPVDEVLEAHEIWHIEALPINEDEWRKVEGVYGDAQLKVLLSYYGQARQMQDGKMYPAIVDDFSAVQSEWMALRQHLWEAKMHNISTADVWCSIFTGPLQHTLKHIAVLAAIGLAVVVSSVPCETGFSVMAIIKVHARTHAHTHAGTHARTHRHTHTHAYTHACIDKVAQSAQCATPGGSYASCTQFTKANLGSI